MVSGLGSSSTFFFILSTAGLEEPLFSVTVSTLASVAGFLYDSLRSLSSSQLELRLVPAAGPLESEGVSGASLETLDKAATGSGSVGLEEDKREVVDGGAALPDLTGSVSLARSNFLPPDGVTGADTATLALELFGESAAGVAMLDPLEREGGLMGFSIEAINDLLEGEGEAASSDFRLTAGSGFVDAAAERIDGIESGLLLEGKLLIDGSWVDSEGWLDWMGLLIMLLIDGIV